MKKSCVFFTLLIETSPQSIPLGAACVASAVKNDPRLKDKLDVKLVWLSKEDEAYIKAEKEGTVGKLIAHKIAEGSGSSKVDFACFSVYVWNHRESEDAAKILKENSPDCVTICGGPEVTANPLGMKGFDYTISGEGEKQNSDLLYKLLSKDETSVNPENREIAREELMSWCYPGPYLDGTVNPDDFQGGALWELSRGCPFKCSYCFESKGSKKVKYFPMEKIEKELELFRQKKVRQVFVLDPTYNADKKRALEILKLIAKKTPNTFYYFEARAEFIDREMAKAFTKIPCCLQFGLQSTNEKVLKNVNRTFDRQIFTRNIGFLNDAGVIFGFDLIFGLPGDNLSGFFNSVDFALKLYPNNLETFCLSVLPGTMLFDQAKDFGLVFQEKAPYRILSTPTFGKEDLAKAQDFSNACNYFYNDGRAVPWFMALCALLKMQPSVLIKEFLSWAMKKKTDLLCKTSFDGIQKTQLDFISDLLNQKGLNQYSAAVKSIVILNGAFSKITDGEKSVVVSLDYDPDDTASPMAQDIRQFVKYARRKKCRIRIKQDFSYDFIK
ncbi:MAG: radical SAM protein [Treponema sp.]|nr:radical SAM protein [Treponema sp.]